MNFQDTLKLLEKYGQEHLLAYYDELSDTEKDSLLKDISSLDFDLLKELHDNADKPTSNNADAILTPIKAIVEKNLTLEQRTLYLEKGNEAIKNSKVAAITMAGGQGSRLGFDGPKGTFDVGLPSHKSLFEIQADGLKNAMSNAGGNSIPWYIMTSTLNDSVTKAFFEEHNYFGYERSDVFFFTQNDFPIMSLDGKIRLAGKSSILRGPDGNGGIFKALETGGAICDMQKRGIEYVFVCNIDNILTKMCDPLFIGETIVSNVPASAKSFIKRTYDEKAGILCYKNGHPGVVEYTEVPYEYAIKADENGEFVFGDANVNNVVFTFDGIKAIVDAKLPYHTAVKKVTSFQNGQIVKSEKPDSYKFEMFIFDAYDFLEDMSVFRIERIREFAPVKNKDGEDSPASARKLYLMENKIQMKTPLVEMDGDEMTRIVWEKIKEILLNPYIDLKTEYYDLGIQNRDATDDLVTKESALATKKYGVAVKCATITPNAARVEEFGLKKMWKSPNGTIRSILDGTVFRAPIIVDGIKPVVKCWNKPIIIARHAYGDIYSAVETKVPSGSTAELTIKDANGDVIDTIKIHDFEKSGGIVMGMHNETKSIEGFARACFEYALSLKMDLWFSSKDTISKKYDHHFKDVFAELYENEYKEKYEKAGITYFYTLIDDAVSRVMKSEGGFVWATKNYDGDVFSDMLASAFGSLSMMTSVLVSPYGYYEYEAAHGTIPKHYHKYLKGEMTSTNPIATIFAWTGALAKRAEMDDLPELKAFSQKLEEAVIKTVSEGYMTGDLAKITEMKDVHTLGLVDFLKAVADRL